MQEMVLLRNLLQLELRNNESSTLSSGSSEVHDSRIISLSFNYIKILYIYRLYGSRMGLLVLHNGVQMLQCIINFQKTRSEEDHNLINRVN